MRFSLLGPLTVDDGSGGGEAPGGARLRVLLAALVLRANAPVSREVLAEAVWDASPPPGAEVSLRGHVLRLRRALGPEAAARITVHDPGYLIRLEPDEADVLQFEALCRETGRALRAADWERASAAGTRAELLWRGTPLLDVPSQVLRDEFVPRFEELRVQVREDRIAADLQLDRHAQLVAQLRELTAAYPLRERFHAQLMLALARGGRRSEALEVYRRARLILVDQLGIEPGPELHELHERVLAGEIEPVAAPPAAAEPEPAPAPTLAEPAEPAAPRQLPAAVRHFVGRRTELDELTRLLDGAGASGGTVVISAIDGMAGIGKTVLAVQAAHRLAEKFPDGQLFIDLHGYTQGYPPRTALEALTWLLRALGVPPQRIPQDADQAAGLYRQRLADTRTLIVLDNAANEAQVRPLLPGTASCLVLITSRRRLKAFDDAHSVSLDVLPAAEAVALLRAVAGPERVSPDDPLAGEVAELCGYLPLALRIAAALLRHRPVWNLEHLAARLRDQRSRVRALSDGERELAALFDLSYASLDTSHRSLWRLLGLVPGADLDTHAAAALAQCDPATADRLLEDLVDHSLLSTYAPNRYRLHDLLRVQARALAAADPAADRESALDRLLHHYAGTARGASALVARYPRTESSSSVPAFTDPETARRVLRTECSNLDAAFAYAHAEGLDEHVIALADGLAEILRLDGPSVRAIEIHRIAADTAERLGRSAAHAAALNDLGRARYLAGDARAAIHAYDRALEIYRVIGNRLGEANALADLARVRRLTGDPVRATEALMRALELYRATGNRLGEANMSRDLGLEQCMAGDYPAAVDSFAEALAAYHAIGNHSGEATVLADLGRVRCLIGDYPGATDALTSALEINRRVGNRNNEALVLTVLGQVRSLAGDHLKAVDTLTRALEIYRATGNRTGEAFALTELGQVRNLAGDYPEAVAALTGALGIYRAAGERGNEAVALNHYAAALAAVGERPRSLEIYLEALSVHRELNKPDDEAISLEGIAEHDLAAGDLDQGVEHLNQALVIYERLGMDPDARRVRDRLDGLAG